MVLDPLTQRITRRIAEAIGPKQIYLFGSRLRGDATSDSDIDLAVVYEGPMCKRQVKLAIHALFPRPDFSLDILVMTPKELETNRHVANTLAREVTEHGLPCYG